VEVIDKITALHSDLISKSSKYNELIEYMRNENLNMTEESVAGIFSRLSGVVGNHVHVINTLTDKLASLKSNPDRAEAQNWTADERQNAAAMQKTFELFRDKMK